MRFEIVTLFPELFDVLRTGLLGKAQDAGTHRRAGDHAARVHHRPTPNGRRFALRRRQRNGADARPDRGGLGPPRRGTGREADPPRLAHAAGRAVLAGACAALLRARSLTLVCGRYEGFDERIRGLVDEEVSLGDFVLLGGEAAALAVLEATARLLPGVLGNDQSASRRIACRGLAGVPAVHAAGRVSR